MKNEKNQPKQKGQSSSVSIHRARKKRQQPNCFATASFVQVTLAKTESEKKEEKS